MLPTRKLKAQLLKIVDARKQLKYQEQWLESCSFFMSERQPLIVVLTKNANTSLNLTPAIIFF